VTTWKQLEREGLADRRNRLRSLGRTPARLMWVYRVTTTVIAIPAWAHEQAVPDLKSTADYVWLSNRYLAEFLCRIDREQGGNPDVLRIESRRCKRCGMLRLNVLAEHRRNLDESAFDGRDLPCGEECTTRRQQARGRL
jgi:hypothetical protein